MLRWLSGLAVAVLLIVGGCDQREDIARMTPQADADFAKAYVALFQVPDLDAIEAAMDLQVDRAGLRPTLKKMIEIIPKEAPLSTEVVGVEVTTYSDGRTETKLKFEYRFPKSWLVVDVWMKRSGERVAVTTVYFTPTNAPLSKINAFAAGGKPLLSYVIFAAAVLVPLFMLVSLAVCLATRIPKRKWLWCILVFANVTSFGVNWTTGQVDFHLLQVGLVGWGFEQIGVDGPMYFSSTIPIGAILFWIRRRKWRALVRSEVEVF